MAKKRIVVIGAGAGGMLAAARAAQKGADVTLLEKTDQPGKKLLISGKTRCNLTNSADLADFVSAYGQNGRFLYSAFRRFFREDLLSLLSRYGVETVTERGGRIFPSSGDAADVVTALKRFMEDSGVRLVADQRVTEVLIDNAQVKAVRTPNRDFPADAVILAAGGSSWPATGSSGDGFRIAQKLGHVIVKLRPALVPLVVKEADLAESLRDVALRNVRLDAYQCPADQIDVAGQKLKLDSRFGEMLITHFGLAGPIVLLMSKAIVLALEKSQVSVAIDLKPALSLKQLNQRLQRDFDTYSKRTFQHLLKELLPQKMIEPLGNLSGISAEKPAHQIASEERNRLAGLLKSLRFNIRSPLSLASAMVTSGGISLREIDPRTMASKLVAGLYFCGEVIDIDADTGGYNLQAAFSTGYVAGDSAADCLTSMT
jgi:predicted Rossmann fold flavoprotein